ncbi:hypothetical protein SPRG_06740 [Saprolegnia parasitica CBS 223.65]|uniref:Uncharacterized protein n=1 Tax=Saprolegnia parasitica (strain CBS 223.65) TaxID=695850 RepID=A0A067CPN0_SAPPC|nr:hypothetical protein SPRG_06740 [Saprolegnia parasitica CBS 223.65]KDO28501.1 hypothetical protein SPRG_06740 [Saprolegnia parasitica CBS 223.65]|eukprot:XP_012200937.1 hypothetical protein SPRG_06740 [Saprolegnia parasitica CBS 223.65]
MRRCCRCICRSVNLPACRLASGYVFEFPSQHQWSVFCQHASCQVLFLELRQIQFPDACRSCGVDSPKIPFVDAYVGSPFHYD